MDLLLQNGVSIDETDGKGVTPLTVACQYGMTMLAAYLIGKGAGVQLVDSDGDTALHWAAFKGTFRVRADSIVLTNLQHVYISNYIIICLVLQLTFLHGAVMII